MLEETATPPTADSDLDEMLRSLADPLPAPAALIFPQQVVAGIQAYDGAITRAELLHELFPAPEAREKIEAFIADVTAQRDTADARLRPAITHMTAEMAQSDRMRGSTISVSRRPVRARSVPSRGPRARGAGRPKAQSTRSSAKSGDSGDDGLADPEPPGPRTCTRAGCGAPIDHLNKDATHCGAKCRVYAQRARDKAAPERVPERSAASQRTHGGGWKLLCRCAPRPELHDAGLCLFCGRPRTADAVAWLADPAPPSTQFAVSGSPERRLKTGDGKRHKVKRYKVKPQREVVA